MRRVCLPILIAAATFTSAAHAQDASSFQGMVAGAVEGFGQSVSETISGSSSIFVTASGTASLPDGGVSIYTVKVEGSAPTAVEAAREHEDRLRAVQAVARRFKVVMQVSDLSITREADAAVLQARRRAMFETRPGKTEGSAAPAEAPPAPQVFRASSAARFRPTDPRQLPAFLDAVQATGVDELELEKDTPALGLFAGSLLGLEARDEVPVAVWDQASRNAMMEARRQAAVLAAAGGRSVGAIRQVISLTRTARKGQAQVVVAVRFAITPAPSVQ